MQIEEIKSKAAPILKRNNVAEAYLFGSTARGNARPDSDIDILARFTDLRGLFEFIRVKHELEDAFDGRRVDLVQMEALRPEFKERVDRQKIQLV